MEPAMQALQGQTMSIKLWPPSKSTRLMLVERMTKNFLTPSILTRKNGLLGKDEAEQYAKQLEDDAFEIANRHHEKEPDADGTSAVLFYAKESSRLMIEVLKRGPIPKEEGGLMVSEKTSHDVLFDISGGRRSFIDEVEAKELLRPLKEEGCAYTKICFSNRSFGLDAARVAEPILLALKNQLTDVDLSDFIAGRPEEEAIEVMNIFSSALESFKLKYLNLSNNAMGEKGIRAFGKLLKAQYDLEELYLMNDGISEEAARAICELIPATQKLRVLQFHNNMTGDEGAIAISEMVKSSPALEDFRCSSTRVGSEGGIYLAEALGTCASMKKIDLRDNMFGVDAGIALSKSLTRFTDLTEIYLSYLNLEDEGTEALVSTLKQSAPSLEVLDIAGNDITIKSASSLASCIATKTFLTKLNLAENELKDEGAIIISKALEDANIQQLSEVDMSTNQIRRAGAKCLARAVVNKPDFKLLIINGNFISDEGLDEVMNIFENCPDMLGPLDENDPKGEDDDDDDEEEKEDDGGDLELKLKGLEIN